MPPAPPLKPPDALRAALYAFYDDLCLPEKLEPAALDKVLRLFDLERPDAAPTTLEGCSSRITKAEYLGADEMTVVTGEDEGKELKVCLL